MDQYWIAVVQGIVEGLTEFLPVSSTGHMILAGELMNFTGDKAKTFEVVIQLGSISAIIVLFWRKLFGMLDVRKINLREFQNPSGLNLLHLFLGMFPAALLGLLLHDVIKTVLFSPYWVVASLVLGGLLLIYAERRQAKVPTTARSVDDLTYRQTLTIGLFQCLALWPGFSRSGSTIAGGILAGASNRAAAEFSFLMAVPMMIMASGYDLFKSREFLSMDDFGFFATGFVTAFVVAMLAVFSFLKILDKIKLSTFAYYRFVLAAVFWFLVLR